MVEEKVGKRVKTNSNHPMWKLERTRPEALVEPCQAVKYTRD